MARLLKLSDHQNSSSCGDGQGPNPSCPPPPEDHQAPPWPPYPLPPPPPAAASHGRSTFATALIIAVPVLAFLALCLCIFVFVVRRRRRQHALLELEAALAAAAPATTFPDDGGVGGEGGGVVHHVWHIRTVGLDAAAIESIALTRYRAGGVLGASDCTVCLGEFRDGELLRLLPKCAHAFHVQCIDTWLRAHVTCPLCRADVIVDPAAAAAEQPDQPPGADDGADAASADQQPASNTQTMELDHQQANEQRVQIDQHDHSSSRELERPRRQIRQSGARAQSFRRVASMDSPSSPPTAPAEEAREDEQAGGEKQGNGGAVYCEVSVSPEPGHQLNRPAMETSLSASSRWTLLPRHCRARSSLLPL